MNNWTLIAGLWLCASLIGLYRLWLALDRLTFLTLLRDCLLYCTFTAVAFVPLLMTTGH